MKLQRITVCDFRAFPGPAPVAFELDGKSLLVYGENGSGKSSLFHAIRGVFSRSSSANLSDLKNSFSGQSLGNVAVRLAFSDGSEDAWQMALVHERAVAWRPETLYPGPFLVNEHPVTRKVGPSTLLRDAALVSGCLDYRSLLATNYKHGDGEINLFDLAVSGLMADFVDLATGKTLEALWQAVLASKPLRGTNRANAACLKCCDEFNNAMKRALALLEAEINQLLPSLATDGVVLERFVFPGVAYNFAKRWADKGFNHQRIGLEIEYRGRAVPRPQLYLNEARQSALGLAMFLGAPLAFVPATSSALKVLALDDVLIGLDHSNRLPVLEVLKQRFTDWQIVLLTHDKTWFDMARDCLPEDTWTCCEIYEGDPVAAAPIPIVRVTQNRPAKALLQKAKDLLALGYVEAAANYTRHAFEHSVRAACELKTLPLSFRQDPKTHQAQDFLDALKKWTGSAVVPKSDWDACLAKLELLKNVVMNPYSHPSAPNIPKGEIVLSIAAVRDFFALVAKK